MISYGSDIYKKTYFSSSINTECNKNINDRDNNPSASLKTKKKKFVAAEGLEHFITFVQCWPNVFDVGTTLYKCYKMLYKCFCWLG